MLENRGVLLSLPWLKHSHCGFATLGNALSKTAVPRRLDIPSVLLGWRLLRHCLFDRRGVCSDGELKRRRKQTKCLQSPLKGAVKAFQKASYMSCLGVRTPKKCPQIVSLVSLGRPGPPGLCFISFYGLFEGLLKAFKGFWMPFTGMFQQARPFEGV